MVNSNFFLGKPKDFSNTRLSYEEAKYKNVLEGKNKYIKIKINTNQAEILLLLSITSVRALGGLIGFNSLMTWTLSGTRLSPQCLPHLPPLGAAGWASAGRVPPLPFGLSPFSPRPQRAASHCCSLIACLTQPSSDGKNQFLLINKYIS